MKANWRRLSFRQLPIKMRLCEELGVLMDSKCEIEAIEEPRKSSFLPTAEPRNRYRQILADACERAQTYLANISDRRVGVVKDALRAMEALGGSLPEDGLPTEDVLRLLDQNGSPATMATM